MHFRSLEIYFTDVQAKSDPNATIYFETIYLPPRVLLLLLALAGKHACKLCKYSLHSALTKLHTISSSKHWSWELTCGREKATVQICCRTEPGIGAAANSHHRKAALLLQEDRSCLCRTRQPIDELLGCLRGRACKGIFFFANVHTDMFSYLLFWLRGCRWDIALSKLEGGKLIIFAVGQMCTGTNVQNLRSLMKEWFWQAPQENIQSKSNLGNLPITGKLCCGSQDKCHILCGRPAWEDFFFKAARKQTV